MLRLIAILAIISVTLAAPEKRSFKRQTPPRYVIRKGGNWFEAKKYCESIGRFLAEPLAIIDNWDIMNLYDSGTYWWNVDCSKAIYILRKRIRWLYCTSLRKTPHLHWNGRWGSIN
ncbi:uncharacterized protein LOC100369836 isoform X1 [Saccoglossus kowalevskii]